MAIYGLLQPSHAWLYFIANMVIEKKPQIR
jgi:hypothetical protein